MIFHELQNDGEGSAGIITPDWDKHSSSSEVSVACLQDKIIQVISKKNNKYRIELLMKI